MPSSFTRRRALLNAAMLIVALAIGVGGAVPIAHGPSPALAQTHA